MIIYICVAEEKVFINKLIECQKIIVLKYIYGVKIFLLPNYSSFTLYREIFVFKKI